MAHRIVVDCIDDGGCYAAKHVIGNKPEHQGLEHLVASGDLVFDGRGLDDLC